MFKKLPKNLFPINISFAIVFLLASLTLLHSENRRIDSRTLGSQTKVGSKQETVYQWEQILTERPDYRDGWIELATLYYQLGEKEKAKEAISQAKNLDPNNENILSFEKFLTD